jgi:hypothetical protein
MEINLPILTVIYKLTRIPSTDQGEKYARAAEAAAYESGG